MPNRIESAASATMGKVKVAKAALAGLHGVFRLLCDDHGQVAFLLEREKLSRDAAKRVELWTKLRHELLLHERAETAVVYAALSQMPPKANDTADRLVDWHEHQADQLEELIALVDATPVTNEEWIVHFTKLADVVADHVRHEETEVFPQAQRLMGEAWARDAAADFARAKRLTEDAAL